MLSLSHPDRITRRKRRVQLGSSEASTWLRCGWISGTLTCRSGISP
jgi:hypothetical protein